MRREKGSHTVEFSVVGAAFFLLLFGALEVGRLMYTLHGLTEATRRGARVAAVCPVGDTAIYDYADGNDYDEMIRNVAAFDDPDGGGDGLIPSLTPDKLAVSYLNEAGGGAANYMDIRYVRVSVTNFSYKFIIPGLSNVIELPELATTLPRESLGVPRADPAAGAAAECPF